MKVKVVSHYIIFLKLVVILILPRIKTPPATVKEDFDENKVKKPRYDVDISKGSVFILQTDINKLEMDGKFIILKELCQNDESTEDASFTEKILYYPT